MMDLWASSSAWHDGDPAGRHPPRQSRGRIDHNQWKGTDMYAKVFTSLFEGSLRGRSDEILVFVNLLTHANGDMCDRHFRAISDETGIPVERVRAAIVTLESPDPESRTPDEEGRRIVRLDPHRDWGWRIVNFDKYRKLRSEEDRREYQRNLMRERREKERQGGGVSTPLASVSSSEQGLAMLAQAEAEAGPPPELPVELPEWFPKTEKDAVVHSGFVGCPPEFAATEWNRAVGRGGRDSKDVPIRNWRNYLAAVWSSSRGRNGRGGSKAPIRSGGKPAELGFRERDTLARESESLKSERSKLAGKRLYDRKPDHDQRLAEIDAQIAEIERRLS